MRFLIEAYHSTFYNCDMGLVSKKLQEILKYFERFTFEAI